MRKTIKEICRTFIKFKIIFSIFLDNENIWWLIDKKTCYCIITFCFQYKAVEKSKRNGVQSTNPIANNFTMIDIKARTQLNKVICWKAISTSKDVIHTVLHLFNYQRCLVSLAIKMCVSPMTYLYWPKEKKDIFEMFCINSLSFYYEYLFIPICHWWSHGEIRTFSLQKDH